MTLGNLVHMCICTWHRARLWPVSSREWVGSGDVIDRKLGAGLIDLLCLVEKLRYASDQNPACLQLQQRGSGE